MFKTFERVGERVLRTVLPQEKADACGWGAYKVIYADGGLTEYERTNSCNGDKQCYVDNYGTILGATCP